MILGVDFQKPDIRLEFEQRMMMRLLKSNTGFDVEDHPCQPLPICSQVSETSLALLWFQTAAGNLLADAGRNIDPGIAFLRLGHRPGTGIRGRLAIVLPAGGYTKALLGIVSRLRRRPGISPGRSGDPERCGGRGEQDSICDFHGNLLGIGNEQSMIQAIASETTMEMPSRKSHFRLSAASAKQLIGNKFRPNDTL
jgi:hypothetical protein